MNIIDIKKYINGLLNKSIKLQINGIRNKKEEVIGTIVSISPNIFTIKSRGINRSFSYSDILIGDIIILNK